MKMSFFRKALYSIPFSYPLVTSLAFTAFPLHKISAVGTQLNTFNCGEDSHLTYRQARLSI